MTPKVYQSVRRPICVRLDICRLEDCEVQTSVLIGSIRSMATQTIVSLVAVVRCQFWKWLQLWLRPQIGRAELHFRVHISGSARTAHVGGTAVAVSPDFLHLWVSCGETFSEWGEVSWTERHFTHVSIPGFSVDDSPLAWCSEPSPFRASKFSGSVEYWGLQPILSFSRATFGLDCIKLSL